MHREARTVLAVLACLLLLGLYYGLSLSPSLRARKPLNIIRNPPARPISANESTSMGAHDLPGQPGDERLVPRLKNSSRIYEDYIIYEEKCRIRNYNPEDPAIMKKFFSKEPRWCPENAEPLIFHPVADLAAGKSCIGLDSTAFNKSYGGDFNGWNCSYREVIRDLKSAVIDMHYVFSERKELNVGDCPTEEFIWIKCERPGNHRIYEQPLMLPHAKGTRAPIRPNDIGMKPLNVLVLGIDSVSRLNAHRQLSQTMKFLQSKKNLIELLGYNKIGLNSNPNQIPLLTGIPYSGPLSERLDSHYFDNMTRYIWEDYEERGYRTMYSEELHQYGLFTYPSRRGFKKVRNPPLQPHTCPLYHG